MTTRLDIGPLEPFHAAGVVDVADVHVAMGLLRMGGHPPELGISLGAALCVRALRAGSVCVDLAADPVSWLEEPVDLPWPADWTAAVANHPLVAVGPQADRPLRLVGNLLYLHRYWQDEESIRTMLQERARLLPVDPLVLRGALDEVFQGVTANQQRLAVATAALRPLTILAGGPGTGKTTTVASLLALLERIEPGCSVALAAPTGKAAARLQQAVPEATSSTLHRLLGWRPDARGRFRHDRSNPLPHDVVVVDETSMVSLPMMARLVDAIRPDARLVLVGDPDQLASIDAGAVLGDLVARPGQPLPDLTAALAAACPDTDPERAAATGVVVLDRNYRFSGAIAELAAAVRAGNPDGALEILRAGHGEVEFTDSTASVRDDVVEQTRAVVSAAEAGDARAALAGLERHRVLCAHRTGPFGVTHWDGLIEGWTSHLVTRRGVGDPWYAGRPLLVTANDYSADLYNGDTGVAIESDGELRAAFGRGGGVVEIPLAQVENVTTLRAMTIHRGQGSQFDAVTVVLPPAESPLPSRELLYTAVTRARTRIRVVGNEEAVRAGVSRQVRRASGLRD